MENSVGPRVARLMQDLAQSTQVIRTLAQFTYLMQRKHTIAWFIQLQECDSISEPVGSDWLWNC